MRETVLSEGCETQIALSPAAASLQACGKAGHGLLGLTLIRAMTEFRFGSIRSSVDVLSLIAQTAPSPTANPPDLCGMRMLATTLPPRGTTSLPANTLADDTTPTPTAQAIDPPARIARLSPCMHSSSGHGALLHVKGIVQRRNVTANTSGDLFPKDPGLRKCGISGLRLCAQELHFESARRASPGCFRRVFAPYAVTRQAPLRSPSSSFRAQPNAESRARVESREPGHPLAGAGPRAGPS
jgi:hypothetical protein